MRGRRSEPSAGSRRTRPEPPSRRRSRRRRAGARDPSVTTAVRITTARSQAPSGREPAERAGVRPAPHGLELLDHLHRAHLRTAGHRSGRERRVDGVERVRPRAEATLDRRDQLVHRRVRLDRAQPGDANAARGADPAEVVAREVDDHRVLGSILRALGKRGRERAVSDAVVRTRSGSLDRPRLDRAVGRRRAGTSPGSPRRARTTHRRGTGCRARERSSRSSA